MARRKQNTTAANPAPAKTEAKAAPAAPAKAKADLPLIKTENIGATAMRFLREVVGQNDKKEPVGMTYEQVLAKVQAEHPGCSTSLKSLAWYNSRMKSNGEDVPFRPRSVRAATVAETKEPETKEPASAKA